MKVVTLGEIMLRLTPPRHERFMQANSFEAVYGGGEANVAVSFANFGEEMSFVSKLPMNEIGQAAINSLRGFGVDTKFILRGGERIGIYYMERGASQRSSKVIYDRKNSSFACSSAEEYDWNTIFADADWFHFTGITPALSKNSEVITIRACEEAKKRNILISCDVNYRNSLWSMDEAYLAFEKLMPMVDVCITNESQAEDVFRIKLSVDDNRERIELLAKELYLRYNLKKIAFTFRKTIHAENNSISAMLYDGERFAYSKEYNIEMVDRIGGGDAFAAGLIYAIRRGYNTEKAVQFATAACCLKHTIEGDANIVTVDEVESVLIGNTGRVQR